MCNRDISVRYCYHAQVLIVHICFSIFSLTSSKKRENPTVSMSIVLCMCHILSLIMSSSTFVHGFCLSHSIISNRREKERYV
jgi:hypothetical protein